MSSALMTKTSLTSFDVNYWVIPSEMDIRKTEVACTYVYLTCTECTSTSVRNGTCCVHVYAIESVHMYLACTGGIRVGTCRVHGTTPYTCTYRVLYGPTEYKRGTCCVHGFSYRCTAHVPNGIRTAHYTSIGMCLTLYSKMSQKKHSLPSRGCQSF